MDPMNQQGSGVAKFRCSKCCAPAGERHAPGCAEAGLASAVRKALDLLAQVDVSKVPLGVLAAIGVLQAGLEHNATEVDAEAEPVLLDDPVAQANMIKAAVFGIPPRVSKVPQGEPAAIGVVRTALAEQDTRSTTSASFVIVTLLAAATAAWHALDDGEEMPDGSYRIGATDAQALAASLKVLDELPDDKPGYTLHGPGRAEWALRGLLENRGPLGADFFAVQLGVPFHFNGHLDVLPAAEVIDRRWVAGEGSQVHPDSALPSRRAAPAKLEALSDERSAAVRDVLAERRRQVEVEGYEPEHDDEHMNDEIAAYAAFYAMPPAARDWPATETGYGDTFGEAIVPADWKVPKEGDRRSELVKAGALVLAEIERIDRAAAAAAGRKGGAA